MKTLITNALSTTATNLWNNTSKLVTEGGTVAVVAGAAGLAVAAKKTSDASLKASEKCAAASQSLTRWLIKHVPVAEQK